MWEFFILIILNLLHVYCLDVYHEGSKITFYPDDFSEYFGYTVVLSPNGLIVGAPKAKSRILKSISPGQIFICDSSNLEVRNVSCSPLGATTSEQNLSLRRLAQNTDFFRNDMWFGSTIALVPNDKLMVCAPRWAEPYKDTHLLANGACYIQTQKRYISILPLKEKYLQAFVSDGSRKQYGEYGTHLNYYAYGQSGFSIKVTDGGNLIIGAPGLLQWTGGVIEYKFLPDSMYFIKNPIANPYFIPDLGPDDYFGYSVESGIFEKNGTTLYVAGAPRSKSGYGLVLIFKPSPKHNDILDIKAKIRGSQLGAYFGSSLLCTDINGDGITDLLVGAPNFVTRNGGLPYDQGAVFIYLVNNQESNLTINSAGYVFGSGESGARFGSTIADLGDIDGDGYNDIAIGSPWENSGHGAVYIYKGNQNGLKAQFIQRITVKDAKSFGISISKALDIDKNNCNDLAVGAHNTRTAYVFRCIPTMHIEISIKVPDAMNLEENASNFTALFCVKATSSKTWPNVKTDLRAAITIDPEKNRAKISEDSEYNVTIQPGNENCDEQVVEVMHTADLSKPITMKFNVEPMEQQKVNSITFPHHTARLSDHSILHTSFDIQLMRGCGEDLICRPLLLMTLEPLNSPYVPGTDSKLGVKVIVINEEEPAFGAKVYIRLPASVKRQPAGCSLEGNGTGKNLTCTLPAPLYKFKPVEWEIELEYTYERDMIHIEAVLDEPFFDGDEKYKKKLSIPITPKANFFISGKALPNATVTVTRDKINKADNVTFVHYFEIYINGMKIVLMGDDAIRFWNRSCGLDAVTNFGPSDWLHLPGHIILSDKVNISSQIKGCSGKTKMECLWEIPAKTSLPLVLPLRIDLGVYGEFLNEGLEHNVTTTLIIYHENKNISWTIFTTLILEPSAPIWPIIVGCIFGFIFLSVITFVLYKCNFFSRNRYSEIKNSQKEHLQSEGTSYNDEDADLPSINMRKSTEDLIDDSD